MIYGILLLNCFGKYEIDTDDYFYLLFHSHRFCPRSGVPVYQIFPRYEYLNATEACFFTDL